MSLSLIARVRGILIMYVPVKLSVSGLVVGPMESIRCSSPNAECSLDWNCASESQLLQYSNILTQLLDDTPFPA